MKNRKSTRWSLWLLSLLALACQGDPGPSAEGRLLPADEELTAEQKRLREMQYMVVVSADPDDGAEEVWDIRRENAEGIIFRLLGGIEAGGVCNSALEESRCAWEACVLNLQFQGAARMLRSSEGFAVNPGRPADTGPSDFLGWSDALRVGGGSSAFSSEILALKFPPQSAATRAWMAGEAVRNYKSGIVQARKLLDVALEQPPSLGECTTAQWESLASEAAAALRQGLLGLERATEEASRLTVAVADQQLGSSTQASISTARGLAGEDLSRAAAAHLYLGGRPGIQGNTTKALCSSFELTQQTQKAIDIIRQLAPPPAKILELADGFSSSSNDGNLEDFLNGIETHGSLKERFEAMRGEAVQIDTIQSHFKLRAGDFAEAIKYLAQELRAYSRNLTMVVSGPPAGTIPRYAAVATPPPDQPDAYWAALTRTDVPLDGSHDASMVTHDDWRWQSEGFPTEPIEVPDVPWAAWLPGPFVDWVALTTALASDRMIEAPEEAQRVLRDLVGASEAIGVFEHRTFPTTDQFSVQLFRDGAVTYFAAVGDDVMRCAVQGSVEGEPCSPWALDELDNPMLSELIPDTELVDEGYSAARVSLPMRAGSRRVYLLRARPGWVETTGEPVPGAGDFEAIMGIAAHRKTGYVMDLPAMRRYGIVPSAETRAAEFMKLSQLDCTRPQLSCAPGGPNSKLGRFDERIPLENELSEDQDGVESSWRYYLARARNAADQSDALAREYVSMRLLEEQRGESQAQRAEDIQRAQEEKASAALDRVQQICGTSVESGRLLSSSGSAGGSCSSQDHPTSIGMVCVNGTWVFSLERTGPGSDNPEVDKLVRCLGGFEVPPIDMQLSTSDLCYWEDDDGNICGRRFDSSQGAPPASAECPKAAPARAIISQPSQCSDPYKTAPIRIENSLRIFDLNEPDGGVVDDGTCEAVRVIRTKVASNTAKGDPQVEEALKRIVSSGMIAVDRLNKVRSALSVESRYDNRVSVNVGGRPWLSTGDAVGGLAGATWPCAGDQAPPGLCVHDGIRCEIDYDCSNLGARQNLNNRLIDAFSALELISQTEVVTANPALESHIEFWLPVTVDYKIRPQEVRRVERRFDPLSVFQTSVAYEWYNSDWRIYTPNGPFPSDSLFYRDSRSISISGPHGSNASYALGFVRSDRGSLKRASTVDAFFGGLYGGVNVRTGAYGKESSIYDGYFVNRAKGSTHQEALKYVEQRLDKNEGTWTVDDYRTISVPGVKTFCDDPGSYKDRLNALGLQFGLEDGEPDWSNYCPHADPIRIPGPTLPVWNEQALWDALELACEAQNEASATFSNCSQPPSIQEMSDLDSVSNYLECVAGNVAASGAKTILPGVPASVAEELKEAASRTNGGVDPVRGELGVLYSTMREAIVGLGLSRREFARIFRGFAVELRQIKSRIRIEELEDELSALQAEATMIQQIVNCAAAVAASSNIVKLIGTFGASASHAAVTCAMSGVQIGLAQRIDGLNQAISEEQRKIILGDAETQFLLLEHAVDAQAREVNSLAESLQRTLAQIESLRREAFRRVNDAIWYLSYEDGTRNEVVDTIMSEQALAAQKRYTQAHANAQRWSFLARRAIEQRLGVELNRLREDLPLVEAPQKWADSVCATSPINYQKGTDGKVPENKGFAEAFIGDYVTKLENVVESYRLQFSFQEGEDVAVVSLRDDVMNVKSASECKVPSENQLFHTGNFGEARQALESVEDVWQVVGCVAATGTTGSGYAAACLSADQVDSPFQAPGLVDGVTRGYELTFSNGTPNCAGNPEVTDGEGIVTGGCSWTPETRLTQRRSLSPGHYRFSWYSPQALAHGAYAGGVWDEEGEPLVSQGASQDKPGVEGRTWHRYFLEFQLDEPKVVEVGFARAGADNGNATTAWEDQWKVTVGAPMLDFVESRVPTEFRGPKPYQNIGETLTVMSPNCEDTDGKVFRATQWKSRCERVCPAGFGGICPEDSLEQCYREASFFISQRAIETGEALVQSGFARGNFNYRFDSVAVNFVGTGLRACETSRSPSTCFGSGFVPYSLYHKGPYFVRNHYGEDYRAHLFEGVIEHARGLAAERYLSNPIGSTDRELLEDFTRTEYQGRPLDGHFVLRVWEEPGVDFSALEDVQLILKYRYWSR